jgi:DNA polymerase-3 subunit gamma/tau
VSPAAVVRLLELIAAALRAMKDGADARTQLELALLKAAAPGYDPTVKALLARIERLEGRAAAAPAAPAATPRAPSAPATAAGRAAAAEGGSEAGRTSVAVTAQVEGQPPVAAATTLPGAPPAGAERARALADEAAAAVSAELATERDPAPAVAAVAVVEPDAPAPEPAFSAGVELSLESFVELWPAVLQTLQGEAPMLAALLEGARPAEVAAGEVTLAWPEASGFLKRKAEDPANKELIGRAIRAVTGSSLRLAYELRAEVAAPEPARVSEEELVARFVEEFDAEVLPPEEES